MKLEDAISAIHAPKGMTTMINAVMAADFDSVREQNGVGASLAKAESKLEDCHKAMRDCKSDWAYWGHQGDASYWTAVVSILKAAEITGPDNLPDIEKPTLNGVVMDVCAKVERYGKAILSEAERNAPMQSGDTPLTPCALIEEKRDGRTPD